MTRIVQPIFENTNRELLQSTKHRFFTMFTPIQGYKAESGKQAKESDLLAWVANPFIDTYLEPAFALDAAIHFLNATASLAKALYTWSLNQQGTKELVDEESAKEFDEAWSSALHAGSMMLAQTLNVIFSYISLLTRPMASIIQKVIDDTPVYSSRLG
ncbi:TPA: hypothetical protein ACPSKE_000750 [Legionella feeleii]